MVALSLLIVFVASGFVAVILMFAAMMAVFTTIFWLICLPFHLFRWAGYQSWRELWSAESAGGL